MSYIGKEGPALDALQRAADLGLSDRFWLDRCPLLDGLRSHPRFPVLHAEVARRTDAILDAYRSA